MNFMFTGIIEEVGTVKSTARDRLSLQAKTVLEGTKVGDSIAVSGACLTVIALDKSGFAVEVMPETRKLTNIGLLRAGDRVNLERALTPQSRIGGHFVQGHVDGMGKLVSLVPEEESYIATFTATSEILRYLVKKGFIAVNGVSLTVTECDSAKFSVSLVTYTRENTNLGMVKQGQTVNLEVDIMAKYMEKFSHPDKREGIINLLDQYDYLKSR